MYLDNETVNNPPVELVFHIKPSLASMFSIDKDGQCNRRERRRAHRVKNKNSRWHMKPDHTK